MSITSHIFVLQDSIMLAHKSGPYLMHLVKNNQDISLNNNIVPGPKTQKNLSRLNIHIRMKPIILMCDINRMFCSVSYQETAYARI